MKKCLLALVLCFVSSFLLSQNKSLDLKIVELMEISGSRQNFELAIESVVETELQKFQNGAFDTKMLD